MGSGETPQRFARPLDEPAHAGDRAPRGRRSAARMSGRGREGELGDMVETQREQPQAGAVREPGAL
eukprot:scaffold31559_cov32-Tisochrysis_lutea.AAC.7